jgi:unsaturated chondroitin disaccharide hydrolase
MRRSVVGAAALVLTLLVPGPPAAGTPHVERTSTTCAPIGPDSVQRDRVWAVAATRLIDLSSGARGTYPFGATGRGAYARTTSYAWTSGFYPASLWLMYERTGDGAWLARARAYTDGVLPVARWTGTHDLGFMVGLPARLGMRLDPSAVRQARYREAIVTAATSLSSRWNRRVEAIKSGEYGGRWGLIIDSAMNAPMLMEAGAMTGGTAGRRLADRGLRHMLTLVRHFVRADGSTAHRLVFNARTGALIGPAYGQGLGSSSTWARGQAWAVNGFAQAYALSGDARLLDAARRTADYWLDHVPAGCIPAWDLDVTSDRAPRDSSAAAIAAEGLQVLSRSEPDPARAARYSAAAAVSLAALTQPSWVPDGADERGVLQRQAYNIPADRREGTYVWGDAYLLLALSRG